MRKVLLICLLFPLILITTACDRNSRSATAPKPEPGSLRIVSLAPAATTIAVDLGLGQSIIGADSWSASQDGVSAGIPSFDMMRPDIEQIWALQPDIILVSAITRGGSQKDPLKDLAEDGIKVIYFEDSKTLEDIRADIRTLADILGRKTAGETLIEDMNSEIQRVSAITQTIPAESRRSAVFEISAAPYLYSFGSGVFLAELLDIAGVRNVFGSQSGWLAVNAEAILAANPDVILTNVSYIEDPVAEIIARKGWETLKAVRNGRVFYIDSDASSQPTHRVTLALGQIARAVYPEYFTK